MYYECDFYNSSSTWYKPEYFQYGDYGENMKCLHDYVIETSGDDVFDIDFANSFYLENDKLVSDSDNGANTIKLVAKNIEYSITKPLSGPGGLGRRTKYKMMDDLDAGNVTLGYTLCHKCGNQEFWTTGGDAVGAGGG